MGLAMTRVAVGRADQRRSEIAIDDEVIGVKKSSDEEGSKL